MKIRESGMPPQDVWDAFFDPDGILDRLGLDGSVTDAVEFGCGYGTFTMPAANRVSGRVLALDIEAEMLAIATRNRGRGYRPPGRVGRFCNDVQYSASAGPGFPFARGFESSEK